MLQLKNPAMGSAAMTSGAIGMYVIWVICAVSACVAPRMMNSVARVTMNDGSPVRTTMKPLMTPRIVVSDDRDEDPGPDRHAVGRHADADDDPGEADQRADRQVEFAGDHQQRDRRPDDPDLGRDVEVVERAVDAVEDAAAGDRG